MRAHCPGLLLAVDRVRAVGTLPEELLASAGEGALPWQLRLLVKRNLKRNRPLRRRWLGRIRETWRPDQATPTSKLSKRWAIDPGGCPQWCWRNPFQPFPKISKKRRTSIFLKLDFRVEHNEKAHERWCMRSLSKKKKKGLWNAGLEYMDDGNTLLYRARSSDMQSGPPFFCTYCRELRVIECTYYWEMTVWPNFQVTLNQSLRIFWAFRLSIIVRRGLDSSACSFGLLLFCSCFVGRGPKNNA